MLPPPTIAEEAPIDPPSNYGQRRSAEPSGRILLVAEDPAVADMLAVLPALLNCRIDQVGGEQAAWSSITRCSPDLVILHCRRVARAGAALCATLKHDPATWRIPIIRLTAQAVQRNAGRCAEEGAADITLHYPVDAHELAVCVRLLLQRRRHNNQLERAEDVIFALARAAEAKDAYTAGHLQRIAGYADAIGARLGLRGEDRTALRYGALLHDIGKIGVDEAILRKAGPLTPAEYATMQQHTILGERIVQPLQLARGVAPIVRGHHERWDGQGYPDRLAGDAIPLGARIVAVADAFDAMTTQRPYNQAIPSADALARLQAGAGTYWDPQIVAVFAAWLRSTVLSDSPGNAQKRRASPFRPAANRQISPLPAGELPQPAAVQPV